MRKIIVSADCNGNMDFLIKKVSALNATNHFDFMLCVGNVMDIQSSNIFAELKDEKLKLPIPIYFIQAGDMCKSLNCLYPNGKELFPNFSYLGRAGMKDIKGVKVAFLSGVANDKTGHTFGQGDYSSKFFTQADVDRVCSYKEEKVDILLTNDWPEDSKANAPKEIKNSSPYISEVTHTLSPRYHFAGREDIYFKRKEYRNRKGMSTSFISIGPINKQFGSKQKYLHAIQIVPLAELKQLPQLSAEIEQNPFEGLNSVERFPQNPAVHHLKPTTRIQDLKQTPIIFFQRFSDSTHQSEIQQFIQRWGRVKKLEIFFDDKKRRHKGCGIVIFDDLEIAKKCLHESGAYSLYGSRIRFSVKTEQNQYTDENCWFCKQSRVFDESLVFYYGKHCYLALDKGPIVDDHFLIIPYKHVTSSVALQSSAKEQIFRLSNRLRVYYLNKKKTTITFERFLNLSHSVNHCIIQSIPVELERIDFCAETFEKKCLNERLDFIKISQVEFDDYVRNKFYFRIQFDERIYVMIIKNRNFPIDFGRITICDLLDLTQRVNWKSCVNQTKSKQQITKFRGILKEIHVID